MASGRMRCAALVGAKPANHVSYIIIDAVIDVPWTRERFKDKPDQFFIKPVAIAEEAWHLTQQDRSAWSFNVELRPYGENW